MNRSKPNLELKGVLMAEAVIASFLMLFAFMAATQLFDASLRWETSSTNDRIAALIAERKMEELRGWVDLTSDSVGFENLDWTSKEGVDLQYPENPGFLIDVRTDSPRCTELDIARTGRLNPPPGLHSPCSQLYARAPLVTDDAQKNPFWQTYPYTREFAQSFRLVKITVRYGGGRSFDLLSCLGDPVPPPAATPDVDYPQVPVVVSGPSSISTGSTETYTARIRLASGVEIEEATFMWSLSPASTGNAQIRPVDPNARTVEITRTYPAAGGTNAELILAVKVRYHGKEILGFSSPVRLP